jgi:hypothetical protein
MIGQSDTTQEAYLKRIKAFKKLSPEKRLEMIFQLSDNLHETIRAGIHQRHPDYTSQQVTQALLKLTLENKLYYQVFPENDIEP